MTTSTKPSYAATVRLTDDAGGPIMAPDRVVIRHHRTPQVAWSVNVASGGHVLHLALAQCVFNNVLRLAGDRGISLDDVSVVADGGFNNDGTASTGIDCTIQLMGSAAEAALTSLAEDAFEESTVVAVLRRAGPVQLAAVEPRTSEAMPPA